MGSLHQKRKTGFCISIHMRRAINRNEEHYIKMKKEKKEMLHEILRIVTEVSKAIFSILRLVNPDLW